MRLAVWLLVVANAAQVVEAQLTASRLPDLPISVSNNAVTSVNHDDGSYSLYSFMGTTLPNAGLATPFSYRYDSDAAAWTQLANAPRLNGRAKVGASAISVAGEVYLIGGYTTGFTERTERRLFRYNDATDDYTELAEVPTEVDDTVVGVFDDRFIILASGWHGPINDNVLDVQMYDTQNDVWTALDPMPGPVDGVFGHSGTLIGDTFISVDGTTSDDGFDIADNVFVGRIETDASSIPTGISWEELTPHPGQPTYRAAASQGGIDGRMLLLGGTDNPYNVSGIGYNGQTSFPLDQAILFNPVTESWEFLTINGDYLPSMDHRGLVQAGDGWVTIGGMNEATVASNRVVLFTVPEPAGYALLALATMSALCVRCR